jgi:hypothetical protein
MVTCDEVYNKGHVFAVFYHYGSNYFHMHVDSLLPLFKAIYYKQENRNRPVVIMPAVEKERLEVHVFCISGLSSLFIMPTLGPCWHYSKAGIITGGCTCMWRTSHLTPARFARSDTCSFQHIFPSF